jgi:hypothetical protein
MGVDWYPCNYCGRTFPDCGDYVLCSGNDGNCGTEWCSDKCAEKEGYVRAALQCNRAF